MISPPGPLSHLPSALPRERGRNAEAGYNLVILVVAITVLNILLAAMLPLASTAIRREKEEELIFRGLQYAEAIRIYQMRFQQQPTTLKQLIEVKPRCIRQLWKDPMTDDGQWGLIFANQPLQIQQVGENPPQGEAPPGTDRPGPDQPSGFGGPKKGETVQTGPILGVYSKSNKKSILVWNGKEHYNEWQFSVGLLTGVQQFGGAAAGGGAPQLSTRWIGRPMPGMGSGALPPGVQNGTMPDGSQPGNPATSGGRPTGGFRPNGGRPTGGVRSPGSKP